MEAEMLLMYSLSDPGDILTLIVRLTVLFAVILTVPLTHFPVRALRKKSFLGAYRVGAKRNNARGSNHWGGRKVPACRM